MTRADKTTPAAQASVVPSLGNIDKGKATTDEKGKYKIEGIAFGDYDIVASLAEASPSDIKKVKVAAGPPQAVDLQLKSILLIVALALALFPGASLGAAPLQ